MKIILIVITLCVSLIFFSCSSKKGKDVIGNNAFNSCDSISDTKFHLDDREGGLNDINETRNYSAILGKTMRQDVSFISLNDLEQIVPQTPKEFAVYYDSISKETSLGSKRPYHTADSLIALYAFRDSGNFFTLYLNMYSISDIGNSDREYMENLFYGVDFAIDANYTKFVKIFDSMSDVQKEFFYGFVK